jgi:predicted nucleotidyltransferase
VTLDDAHVPVPVRRLMHQLRDALHRRFGERLREVVLFGSYARGHAHEDSDIDALVVIDDLTERERLVVFEIAHETDALGDELLGLSVVAHSSAEAAEMRARDRKLYHDVDREGLRA